MYLRSIFGNKYPKLSVSEKGKILNVAAQVSDESHVSLVITGERKIQKYTV